jgi:hypothetical protein
VSRRSFAFAQDSARSCRYRSAENALGMQTARATLPKWMIVLAVMGSVYNIPVARKLIYHYGYGGGVPLQLTAEEYLQTNPNMRVSVDYIKGPNPDFVKTYEQLLRAGGGTAPLSVRNTGWSGTNGTLNVHTGIFNGNLTVNPNGSWQFDGTMTMYDFENFDTKANPVRSPSGENKTWILEHTLPGTPYDVTSVPLRVSQNDSDPSVRFVDFPGYRQEFVNDELNQFGIFNEK